MTSAVGGGKGTGSWVEGMGVISLIFPLFMHSSSTYTHRQLTGAGAGDAGCCNLPPPPAEGAAALSAEGKRGKVQGHHAARGLFLTSPCPSPSTIPIRARVVLVCVSCTRALTLIQAPSCRSEGARVFVRNSLHQADCYLSVRILLLSLLLLPRARVQAFLP